MAGTSWPDLIAGRTAKASEVESKFDWLEGNLVPMNSGTTTDVAYDLGTESARWRRAYFTSINPTSTAGGVAIGTTTADAGALLDLAGTKALILPRLSTAQRDALTGRDGMMIFNSTTGQYQLYKTALTAWSNIGGTVFRTNPAKFTSTTNVATTSVWSVASGGGRIHGIHINAGGNVAFSLVLDGITVISGATSAAINIAVQGDGSFNYLLTTTANVTPGIMFDFATSATLYLNAPAGNTVSVNFIDSSIV